MFNPIIVQQKERKTKAELFTQQYALSSTKELMFDSSNIPSLHEYPGHKTCSSLQ